MIKYNLEHNQGDRNQQQYDVLEFQGASHAQQGSLCSLPWRSKVVLFTVCSQTFAC
jgi:hypothetical protein